jgi:ABC-type lipoprotein release transport system permease subunit
MRKNLNFVILTLIILGVYSCDTSKKEKTRDLKALKEEVLAVHDEVMPKMGELRKVEKALKKLLDEESIEMAEEYQAASENLASANESMMVWMRGFDPNFTGSEEEIERYLYEQLAAIKQVKEDMIGSLEAGKKLLGDN